MFTSGEMESEEYHRLKDDNERQITLWESRTSDRQKIKLELTAAQGFINRLHEYWNVVTGEDKKLLAHSLFEKIVYDLSSKRIVSFKIKAWAEPFVQLRASLYADEMSEEMKNRFNSGSQGLYRIIAPTGLGDSGLSWGESLKRMSVWLLEHTGLKTERSRNELIRLRHAAGEKLADLAREYGLSPQRVHQIVRE
jgi:hypothetical protein